MTKVSRALVLTAVFASFAYADGGGFANSGGSTSVGAAVIINSSVASPAGSLSINCPVTGPTVCAGGSFTFLSTDGTMGISAAFTSGTYVESCSGGGRGGHITCSYTFTGYFSGTLTLNAQTQGVIGVTSQAFGTGGAAASGKTGYNSAYSPFYYSDTEQILRSDDLMGTNQITFGSQGGGVGQFYGAYAIALDSIGRIYVADTYNCRVTRMDDMNGTNWATYGGTCGSAQGQFYDPQGIAVDAAGKIYIMDTGNSRFVRIDDMTGANWTTYGTVGSGTGQFLSFTWVTAAGGHLYIADAGNRRIVRIDDMNGTNWTTLTQSQPVGGVTYSFGSPVAVAVDSAGKLYVADNGSVAPEIIRVDDMTGANWTSIYVSPSGSTGLNSISVDSGASVYGGGGGARIVDNMTSVLNSSGAIAPFGTYYVFGVTPVPLPSPLPSAISFTPPTLALSANVGSTSAPQTLTITNFGGSPLGINGVSTSGVFAETNNCPSLLPGGSACTVSVTFTASALGTVNGTLTVTDNSFNLGGTQLIPLTGTGTAPAATVTPSSLHFSSQIVGTTSAPQSVTLQNTGSGPMQVTNVAATGPFNQTSNCIGSLAAGASCTVQVTFTPTALGAAAGNLAITDDAGTQNVSLSGTGSGPVRLSPSEMDFGTVAVGGTSAPQTATLTNGGSATVTINSITTSAGFAISGNTCGSSLGGASSCTISVTFSPTAGGSYDGTLTVNDSALGSPQVASLAGTGGVPANAAPSALNFGAVAVGSTSSPQTVTLTNGAGASLTFSSVAASAGFGVVNNTCVGTIGSGASCTVGVTFSPTTGGVINGTLTFTDSASNSPQTVSLTGTGSTVATASPTSLSFGQVRVGHTSSPKTVTLTNTGGASLSFSSITASASYAISSNTCGASLAAGANCTVGVTFTPAVKGTINGTLTFTDTALNSPQVVSLTGSGK